MKVLVCSTQQYDRRFLQEANRKQHELRFVEARLDQRTAILARGFAAICCFVDDNLDAQVLRRLSREGVRLVALRATGFNNVDIQAADELGMTVMRVSSYSPCAVAEFAVGMILTLNRKIHRAYNRVRDGNFLLHGLLGFDLYGKTVGIVGTGKIGSVLAKIMQGFGCKLLGYDVTENPYCRGIGMRYATLEQVLGGSDIVSLHAPLTPQTRHLINKKTLLHFKRGAMLINTSRGALIDTRALVQALKSGQLGAAGLDVYEEESHLYYQDLSDEVIPDDVIARLLTFPNVVITGHQAFFTEEALHMIAATTIENINDFAAGRSNENILKPKETIRLRQKDQV